MVMVNFSTVPTSGGGLFLGFLSLGAIPATAGALRLSNDGAIRARDAGNGQDVRLLVLDSSDILRIGVDGASGPAHTSHDTKSSGTHTFRVNTAQCFQVGNGFVSVGTAPAGAGAVRLGNNAEIRAKDAGGSVDIRLIVLDSSDILRIGVNGANGPAHISSDTQASGTQSFRINTSLKFQIDSTGLGFFGVTPVAQQADWGALTDNIAGTVNNTLDAVPDPADAPASADALRDDLVANTIPQIRDALSTLAARVNSIRTDLRNLGLVA